MSIVPLGMFNRSDRIYIKPIDEKIVEDLIKAIEIMRKKGEL